MRDGPFLSNHSPHLSSSPGPLVLLDDPDDTGFDVRSFLCLVAFGVIVAGCTVVFATDGSQPVWRLGRCLLGFSVAMVWIMSLGTFIQGGPDCRGGKI